MPQVDFYVPDREVPDGELLLACRVAELAYRAGHRAYVYCLSEAQARMLDGMLWSFRAESFVPHARAQDPLVARAPVVLGYGFPPPQADDLLLNLTHPVPSFFEKFRRIAELVEPNAVRRAQSRHRYNFYRKRGIRPETHEISLGTPP